MIIVMINARKLELNEEAFPTHEPDIRAAVQQSVYTQSVERIVREARQWAEAWEQMPDDSTMCDGFPALVELVADRLNLPPGVANGLEEVFVECLVNFKQAWVDVSHDPTEAGQSSDSLQRVTVGLGEAYRKLYRDRRLAVGRNEVLPVEADTITTNFLENKYTCHHNAARDIRQIFTNTTDKFVSALDDPNGKIPFRQHLLRRWNDLTFSAKAGGV